MFEKASRLVFKASLVLKNNIFFDFVNDLLIKISHSFSELLDKREWNHKLNGQNILRTVDKLEGVDAAGIHQKIRQK